MPLAALGLCLWWPLAKLGLCLAGVDGDELSRLLRQRLRVMVVLLAAAAVLVVMSSSVSAGADTVPSVSPAASGLRTVALAGYAVAGAPALLAAAVWLYARTMVRRALRDRERPPMVVQGTLRRIIVPRAGGWPVLVRRVSGRGRWLTGSTATLEPVRGRLTRVSRERPFQLRVTLTYYGRSRVIKEITGVVVEDLAAAWAASGVPATDAI